MSKDSHFTGQPVYYQVLKLLDKEKILQISHETKGIEAYMKRFDSLRELEIGMKAEAHKIAHLGMDYLVRQYTSSSRVLCECLCLPFREVRQVFSGQQ